jgi:pilus assembly protein CpaC
LNTFLAIRGRGGILNLDGPKQLLTMLGGIIITAASLCPQAIAQGAVPPSTQQPATAGQQSPGAQQVAQSDNFAGNQVLHILVGHSVVIRTDARLRRVLVGNPAVVTTATTAANEVVVTAIASGSSSVVLWQEDNKSRILEVFGDVDVSLLREAVARSFPNEPIQVEAEENRIVLTGTATAVPVADQIAKMAIPFSKEIVNSIRIALPGRQKQILLKVRFAQVDRSKVTAFGINLFSTGGKFLSSGSTQQFGPPQLTSNSNNSGGSSGGGQGVSSGTIGLSDLLNLFIFRPDIDLGATIKDLEQRNVLQILAEPNLLAANGESARFLAGGELPYPVVSGVAGAATVTVQFKPFGVKLEFTGIIQDDNTIRLKVYPEVSSLDFSNAVTINGFVLPAIATRHAETTVELRNGQSFGIAGLLDQRTTSLYSKVPGIGDIPILGLLFRSKSISKTNSELVVIVTPSIIDPAAAENAAPELPKAPTAPLDPKHFDSKIPSGGNN